MSTGKEQREAQQRGLDIVMFCAERLGRMHDGQLKRAVADRYQITPRSAEKYITEARRHYMLILGHDKESLSTEIGTTLLSIIRGSRSSNSDRIRAARELIKLFGLRPPQQVELSGSQGFAFEFRDQVPPAHSSSNGTLNGTRNGTANGTRATS